MGSGAAVIHEADGTLYLYLLHNAGPDSRSVNHLYKRQDGRFRDVTAGSGLDVAGFSMGVAVADVNNDGRPDLATILTTGKAVVLLNTGTGNFPIGFRRGWTEWYKNFPACVAWAKENGFAAIDINKYTPETANQVQAAGLVRTFRPIFAGRAQITSFDQPDLEDHKLRLLHDAPDEFLQDRFQRTLLRDLQQ